jgi:hypothetical protein
LRRHYNRSLSTYFKSPAAGRRDMERRIAVLQQALKMLDFKRLRSEYPPLAGGSAGKAVLRGVPGEALKLLLDGAPVKLFSSEKTADGNATSVSDR